MAIAEQNTLATALKVQGGLVTRIFGAAGSVYRTWSNRKQFNRLRDMSDWELADIGLERSDLYDAWARGGNSDPTGYLNSMARARDTLEGAARRVA